MGFGGMVFLVVKSNVWVNKYVISLVIKPSNADFIIRMMMLKT